MSKLSLFSPSLSSFPFPISSIIMYIHDAAYTCVLHKGEHVRSNVQTQFNWHLSIKNWQIDKYIFSVWTNILNGNRTIK